MAASLASAPINLGALRELARRELIDLLDSVRGKKALVLDPKVAGPLGLVAEFSLLKDHGVENIYYLNPGKLETDQTNIIYFCRPKLVLMKYIAGKQGRHERDAAAAFAVAQTRCGGVGGWLARSNEDEDQIHAHSKGGQAKDYSLFMIPRRTKVCERILEEEGVLADVQLGEFNLDLVPFDDDLLSLEMDSAFREVALEGDRTSMFYVARALMKLQSIFGIIPRITGKGVGARVVADMMVRMRRELGTDDSQIPPEIDQVILLDRSVLTYEGLIDEVYAIQNTYVDLEPAITGFKEKRKVPLTSADSLYRTLRDRNFSTVGPLLNQSAKRINAEYEERHAAKTVTQIREFIGKLGAIQTEHQSLRIHTNVAERIMTITKDVEFHRRLEVEQNLLAGVDNPVNVEYIEELIFRQEPFLRVMRLLCLLSMTTGGLKPKVLENFRREIIQTYGYDKIFTLNNLEKVGMLKKAEPKNNYAAIRKTFRLFVDDVNEKEPNDIAYVYSGYAPLSVRLVQAAVSKTGLKPLEETLKLIPGPTFDETQQLPPGLQPKKSFATGTPSKVTIVFFLGGCTFTEIAALRFMSDQGDSQRDYIVATTKLINGNTLLDSIVENVENKTL